MKNVTEMSFRKRETIGWIDFLRVFAAFLVVFSHNCDSFVASFDRDYSTFLTGVLAGSLTRPCVPLFVMMTGVLLLPVKSTDLGAFYRKRIGRLIKPLVFWSLALPLAFWAYFSTAGASTANPSIVAADFNNAGLLNKLYTWIFNFNFDTTPLWYLYMLAGLYLVMPMLSAWLERADKRDVRLVLKIWAGSLFLPYLNMLAPLMGYQGNYGNMGLFGVCDWNVYGTFYYVSGFAGYLLLAYYLSRWPLNWSWSKTWAVCLPSFLVGYAMTAGGYVWFQEMFPGDYAYLEIVWLFCGINVLMMTVPLFIVVQKWNPGPSLVMARLASLSFGVYLCHFVFVYMAFDWFNVSGLSPVVRIVCGAVVSTLLAVAVSFVFQKIRPLRQFIA